MAPTRVQRKQTSVSPDDLQRNSHDPKEKALPRVPLNTMEIQRSPIKRRKLGITLAQKQTLIDNLQLEITERARRLRATYSLQAQVLRSRIEIRLNRIPLALRNVTIGDLLDKYAEQERKPPAPTQALPVKPPPVPEKDTPPRRQNAYKPGQVGYHYPTAAPPRGYKRLSDDMLGYDKENDGAAIESPKKRVRGGGGAATSHHPYQHHASLQPGQVLSPTSSNARLPPSRGNPAPSAVVERPASPTKSLIARPVSPTKPHPPLPPSATRNNAAAAGRATRTAAVGRPPAAAPTRKTTTSSTASSSAASSSSAAPMATRGRRGAATTAAPPPPPKTVGRPRKVSVGSEASDGSTATVVKRAAPGRGAAAAAAAGSASRATGRAAAVAVAAQAPAAAAKRSVMSSIRKGVTNATTGKRGAAAAAAAAAAPPPATTRMLRKRVPA